MWFWIYMLWMPFCKFEVPNVRLCWGPVILNEGFHIFTSPFRHMIRLYINTDCAVLTLYNLLYIIFCLFRLPYIISFFYGATAKHGCWHLLFSACATLSSADLLQCRILPSSQQPCPLSQTVSLWFWVNDQLDAQLHHIILFYYYNPIHVLSNSVLIIKRSDCINTASGIVFFVSDRPVCTPDGHLTEYYTRCCIKTYQFFALFTEKCCSLARREKSVTDSQMWLIHSTSWKSIFVSKNEKKESRYCL